MKVGSGCEAENVVRRILRFQIVGLLPDPVQNLFLFIPKTEHFYGKTFLTIIYEDLENAN
jgi:hypothetical protein